MCGIFACHHQPDAQLFKSTALRMAKRVRHRGPDWSGVAVANNTILVHERLSIVGVDSGAQPLYSGDRNLILAANGEIYNHRQIRKDLSHPYEFGTDSDCEVILPLYKQYGIEAPKHLDGMFSFVLYDKAEDRVIAARDPIGVTSFYQGWNSKVKGAVYFASELKSLHPVCDKIVAFPPGHVFDSKTGETTRYFQPSWWDPAAVPSKPADLKLIRRTFENAVHKRLMTEVPFGVLLSGGLDSSLVAAIAQRENQRLLSKALSKGNANGDDSPLGYYSQLNSFSIGLPGSPDGAAAAEVAAFLGTKHHSLTFTIDDGLDALAEVIYHLETYDVTTIRASTPMFLLSRKIKAMGIKMVLSGEGSDEIFGGYLYFHNAPSREEFHSETVRRIKNLHLADCLRANKSTSAWGLEARVPFLDKEFLEVSMSIDPTDKLHTDTHIEKHILRAAFDTTLDEPSSSDASAPAAAPYLPHHILYRQKEQFSDGVGYGWIDALRDEAARHVTDAMLAQPKEAWIKSNNVPETKEAYWYRCMFDDLFPPYCADTVEAWTPKWTESKDPSGRAVGNHVARYENGHGS